MSKLSQATLLVELVRESDVELFHGSDETAYVRIDRESHRENWPLRSKPTRRWLARLCYESYGTTPGAQALQDGLLALEGLAFFEGLLHEVELRLARHEDAIYLDLADDHWNIVEITAQGWQLVEEAAVTLPTKPWDAELARPDQRRPSR